MILDTSGLSAEVEGYPEIEFFLRKASRIAIPAIVLGEYRYGIWQSSERRHYEQWLAEYLPTFQGLNVDEQATIPYVAVRSEPKRPARRFLRTTFGSLPFAGSTRFPS